MRILVTGSSGLVGTALVTTLQREGHQVLRLVRRAPRSPDEARWDPAAGTVDTTRIAGVDAAVHLAGAGIGDRRWTDSYRQLIRDSRVHGTRTLAAALAGLDPRPSVLVSGSAVGFYGDRGEEELTEDSAPGEGFLADVAREWETATAAAEDAGIRVVHARTGLVMDPAGGALARMLLPARLGLGGPLGDGRQWWPWITLHDEVSALVHLLGSQLSGPVNLCAPTPARNVELARALGEVLHRPALLPVPAPLLRAVLGGFATDVLGSQRALPRRLDADGFRFGHGEVRGALRAVLA